MFNHVVVIFGIGFIAVQAIREPILTTYTGSTGLWCSIGRNRQLMETRLIRSSCNKRLYDTAIQIAKLAVSFDPLPAEIVRHTDVLHLTRSWHFNESVRLIT